MKEPKPKACVVCGSHFLQYKSTDKCCSFQCSIALRERQEIEVRYQKAKASLKKSDSVKQLTKVAKLMAQKFARLRDREKPCISCGADHSNIWNGGHMYKSELYSGVRFDQLNIHKQCTKCNLHLNGNEVGYVHGFIQRYGLEKFNQISTQARQTKNKKWSVPELQEIINDYKLKLKE